VPETPHHSPLTLEDLLRLKRAERPSPEFWSRFEKELRQKQLAALIERRPWWQSFPQYLARPRMFMPIGAAAILVFTLVSVKYSESGDAAGVASNNLEQVVSPVQAASSLVAASDLAHAAAMLAPTSAILSAPDHDVVAVAVEPLSEHLPEHAAELTPWSATRPVQSPSAKLFATNNTLSERTDARLNQTLTSKSLPVAYSQPQRSGGAVAELASVSALSSKRTRLLAQLNERQFSPEPQAPAIVRERLTRRLANTDTTYSEHFTRVGLKGDQVSLRF